MLVREIMSRPIRTVSLSSSIQVAAEAMRKGNVGILPVTEGNELVGVVTDRDITIRAVADGLAPTTPVDAVMTPDVVFCFEDQPVEEAARTMEEEGLRRLLVYARDGTAAGVLSLTDIAVSRTQGLGCEVLEEVSKIQQFEDRLEYPEA